MEKLKYSEILKENNHLLELVRQYTPYKISVLSNITCNQLEPVLSYNLRKARLNPIIKIGNYDNIIQDSLKFNQTNAVLVFWEVSNLIEGLQHEIELFDDKKLNNLYHQNF